MGEFASRDYELLPFKFLRLGDGRLLLTNLVGEYIILSPAEFEGLMAKTIAPNSKIHGDLMGRHFIVSKDSRAHLELLATKYRTRLARRPDLASLHLFVVTLRCDHSCSYCQVSRVSEDRAAFDMTEQIADRAIDIMLESPSPHLKVEFQGGESLLNFPLIQYIVARVKRLASDRALSFVVTSNLSHLTEEMVEVCAREGMLFSTSLDGPEDLHNSNRPRPDRDSHARTLAGIELIRRRMGSEAVSALMTATSASLGQPEAIIDEYARLGFKSVFLRFISPYGFAVKSHDRIGYETAQFIDFYKRGMAHLLKLNLDGVSLCETYSTLLLGRMLTPFPDGYVDLQSPAGLGLSVLAYNYDGTVYASDEGRMMAEMGNDGLRLGTVEASYQELIMARLFQELLLGTMTEGMPGCSDCAFQPWCGSDPAFHLRTQGDPVGHRPTSAFCQRQMAIFRHLIGLLENPTYAKVLRSWLR